MSDHKQHEDHIRTLVLGALGVVYGDIGTSPLYAIRECFSGSHSIPLDTQNIFGILSLVFWALILVISVKYMVVVLRADNKGEGGILALMALSLHKEGAEAQRFRVLTVGIGLFGAALLYGDGMITPAISVLSAVEGLEVATPVATPYVVPITLVILCALFVMQRFGTGPIGMIFGPVILVWFLALGLLGIYGITQAPGILLAINPWHALVFFHHNPWEAFVSLGAVFLVVTGGEALYADMGHFGRRAIQIGWFGLVLPGLLLNYFGQGAILLLDPEAAVNPFFHMAPRWSLIPLVILATSATIIASQAVISGAFSLTRQAVLLDYLPRVTINHTSARQMGQIYVPEANWSLLIATLALVIGFKTSSNLAAAYGVAVTTTMLFTTVLIFPLTYKRWGWPMWLSLTVLGLFLIFDVGFFLAAMLKITHGGWFPLTIGAAGFLVMTTWRRGRDLVRERIGIGMLPLKGFVTAITQHPGDVKRVRGAAVFMSGNLHATPRALLHNLKYNKVLHEVTAVLTILIEDTSHVRSKEKIELIDLGEGFYQIVARFGFMESPKVMEIVEAAEALGLKLPAHDTAFFLGRETLVSTTRPGMARWRERLFIFLSRNSVSPTTFFDIPARQVVELGVQVDI